MEAAREKAYRSPLLMIAIARLADPGDEISTAERLVSLGAALQNLLLGAQALGYGAGLTSGQGITSRAIRALFNTRPNEEPVCFVSIGTPGRLREPRLRPQVEAFCTSL
jgi:nitroreductase